MRLKVVINYHAQPSNYIRKAAAVKDNGGSGYGRGGFPASDIRYRSRDPEAESETGTAAESLTSDLRDLGSDLRDRVVKVGAKLAYSTRLPTRPTAPTTWSCTSARLC